MLIRYLLFTVLVVFNHPLLAASEMVEEAASAACACLESPYRETTTVLKVMDSAKKKGDMETVIEKQKQLITIIKESTKCFVDLSAQHPEIDQSETLKQEVINLVEQKCPNPISGH